MHIDHINYMLEFLEARARGEVPTGAKFIRDFIKNESNYKHDSKLSICTMTLLVHELLKLNNQSEEEQKFRQHLLEESK